MRNKYRQFEDQGQKQVEALNNLKSNNKLTIEDVIPENALNNDEAKKELDKTKEIEKNVDREKLIYKTNEYTYSFKSFQTTKTFGRDIYEGKKKLMNIERMKSVEIINFRKNTKPRSQEKNKRKKLFLKTCIIFFRVEKKLLTLLKAKYFSQNLRVQAF